MKKPRETDVLSHYPLQPSLTNPTQYPLNEDRDMKDAIIIRNSLIVTKLPRNAACRVVRTTAKPNQRNTIVFEDTIDHVYNAPPFHHPLDTQGGKTL